MPKTGVRGGGGSGRGVVRAVGVLRRKRAVLLRETALQAAALTLLALPARAQPAANARPTGGSVIAGSATIGQTATTTTITQTTPFGALTWSGFDVGAGQSVQFRQPSANALTVNEVTAPNPSLIAGHIDANGRLVLINRSGVVFYPGAQVDAAGLVVSAIGMNQAAAKQGQLVLDQPARAGARIVNAGTLTVKQAGLAALVAPQVANSGVISAKLGRVVLAGGAVDTVDLYGDGLVAFDVTGQAHPMGDGKTALVTNTGTVLAQGGTVTLTAAQADGLVQTLVDAGGRIVANSVGAQRGAIEIAGTGGSIVIAGRLAADGRAPGETGGSVAATTTGTVLLTPTAHVSASGTAGGGAVALGTTLARATGGSAVQAPTAKRVAIAKGARIAADATGRGAGGTVTALSTEATIQLGTISARGGPRGGDGGHVEISSAGALDLAGIIDVAGPLGAAGTILVDPTDLVIANAGGNVTPTDNTDPNLAFGTQGTSNPATITVAQIEGLHGNIHLEASNNLTVGTGGPLSLSLGSGQALTLEAGNNLTVSTNATLTTTLADMVLTAASKNSPTPNLAGSIDIAGTLVVNGNLTLNAGSGGIGISAIASVTAGNITVNAPTGAVSELSGGLLNTPGTLFASAATIDLPTSSAGVSNSIGTLGNISTSGGLNLTTSGAARANGALSVNGPLIETKGAITLSDIAGGIVLNGNVLAATGVTLDARGAITQSGGSIGPSGTGTITLSGSAGGAVSLNSLDGALGSFSSNGGFSLIKSQGLVLTGNLDDPSGPIALTATSGDLKLQGSINTNGTVDLQAKAGSIVQSLGTIGPNDGFGSVAVNASAANVILLTDPNLIAILGALTATSGGITVTQESAASPNPSVPVTILGPIHAGTGQAIVLTADSIDLTNTPTVSAPNGSIQLAPATAASGVALWSGGPLMTSLSVATPNLINFTAGALILGSASTGAIQIGSPLGYNGGPVVMPSGLPALGLAGAKVTQTDPLSVPLLFGSTGAVNLPLANNVGTIGAYAASGSFALTNAVGIVVGGALSVPGGAVSLIAQTGAIGETGTGSITAASLSGSAGQTVQLDATHVSAGATVANNQIGTLAGFTSFGGFALANGQALTVSAPLSDTAGPVALSTTAGGLALGASITAVGSVTLNSAGAITQTAGTIGPSTNAPLALTGSAGGAVSLPDANQIATLAGFTSSGGFTLADAQALTVSAPLQDTGANGAVVLSTTTGDLTLNANLIAASATLDPFGALTQTAGTIAVGMLAGNTGGTVALPDANAIAALGSFTAGGAFSLSEAAGQALTLTGPLAASSVNFSGGTITESTGVVNTPTLSANVAALSLAQGNSIGLETGLTATIGGVTLAEMPATALTVGGSISVPVGQTIALTADTVTPGATPALNAPGGVVMLAPATPNTDLTFFGAGNASGSFVTNTGLSVNAGTIALGNAATGTITLGNGGILDLLSGGVSTLQLFGAAAQETGAIRVGTLSGVLGGNLTLPGSNQIATLGSFTSTSGSLTLTEAPGQSLGITGPVTATGGGASSITAPGGIAVGGNIDASALALAGGPISQSAGTLTTGGALTLSGGPISQSGGIINATTLTGSGGPVSLVSANTITNLGNFTSGDFTLTEAAGQTVSIVGTVSAQSVTLNTGAFVENGGIISAVTLAASGGALQLLGANQINTLGSIATSGGVALTEAAGQVLTVSGPVTDPNNIALTAPGGIVVAGSLGASIVSLTGGAITQTGGTISAPFLLTLNGGPITQTGGVISAGTLSGAGGPVDLPDANSITALGSFMSSGGFALTEAAGQALTVYGPLTDSTLISLDAPGGMTLAGTISAPIVSLSGGAITQIQGPLIADSPTPGPSFIATGALTGSAASASLTQPNQVKQVAGFSTGGDFVLTEATGQSLAIAGAGLHAGGAVLLTVPSALTLTAGTLAGASVALAVDGAVSETGGVMHVAGALTGRAGDLSLGGANEIASLGSLTSLAGLAVTNDSLQPLGVTGPVTAQNPMILTAPAGLGLAGNLSAPAIVLNGGAITQSAGTIATTTLSGAAQSATLVSANAVGTLASFTAPGGLVLTNAAAKPLIVSGPVQSDGAVTLTAPAGLTIAGSIAGGTVSVNAATVSESGGLIAAGTLTGTTGTATLTAANAIGTLGDFSASSLALNDAGALTLAGIVNAPSVSLTAGGAISQTGGALIASTLTGAAPAASFSAPGNRVTTLGSFTSAGAVLLADAIPLAVAGPVGVGSLTLIDPATVDFTGTVGTGLLALDNTGSVSQTSGTISAARLTGSVGASVQLGPDAPGPVAEIGSIGAFSVSGPPGRFVLNDAVPLTITGPLSAPYIVISAPGRITLDGALIATLGAPLAQQNGPVPAPGGSDFNVLAAGPGTPSFVGLGSIVVEGLGGAPTLRIQVPTTGGSIALGSISGGDLTLVLGQGPGQATGNVNVGALLVVGTGGSANLTGSVGGLGSEAAARQANILPLENAAYRINSCPIHSVNCVLIGLLTLPTTNPLQDLAIDSVRAAQEDPDVMLPVIASQDY